MFILPLAAAVESSRPLGLQRGQAEYEVMEHIRHDLSGEGGRLKVGA